MRLGLLDYSLRGKPVAMPGAGGGRQVALWRGKHAEKQRPPSIAGINLPAILISLPDRGSASLNQAFGGLQPR